MEPGEEGSKESVFWLAACCFAGGIVPPIGPCYGYKRFIVNVTDLEVNSC